MVSERASTSSIVERSPKSQRKVQIEGSRTQQARMAGYLSIIDALSASNSSARDIDWMLDNHFDYGWSKKRWAAISCSSLSFSSMRALLNFEFSKIEKYRFLKKKKSKKIGNIFDFLLEWGLYDHQRSSSGGLLENGKSYELYF